MLRILYGCILTAALFALTGANAGEAAVEKISSASKVRSVTVFLGGAEITREMTVDVLPGKNVVSFGNLPVDLSPQSVTAGVSDGAELMSVVFKVNHLDKPEGAERIERLNAELKATREEMERNASATALLDAEEEFLKKNSGIAGRSGIQLDNLREVADYYRARLSEIAASRFDAKRNGEELKKKFDRLTAELGGATDAGNRPTGEITVELAASKPGKMDVSVSYFVYSAGWTPFYEIRVANLDGPARLVGKGNIWQSTGEDWSDVPVVLSSGRPASGGSHPELMPWYLDFDAPPVQPRYQSFGASMSNITEVEAEIIAMADMIEAQPRKMTSTGKETKAPVARQEQTSVEFVLPAPISVPSGGEGYVAETMNAELPAKYEHYSVRKLDMDVFLLAKIEGWEKLSILEGEAGIFLGNTYVGKSYIEPRRADDTMEISLGRDSGVIVTRVKGRDSVGKSLLGTSNRATREWVLTVRNTRSTPIDIRVLDQIPVSANKDIKVEAVEISGATHNAEKGELRWELHLEPGESVQKTVKYAVTYPKDRDISLE